MLRLCPLGRCGLPGSPARRCKTYLAKALRQHGVHAVVEAPNNSCNQQEERPAAEENRRRDDQARPYREMRNQITTALLNLTGNGLTWVPR
jgi:hypothetical protein